MMTQVEDTVPLPPRIGHNLAAAELRAEYPPLGHDDYDNAILDLIHKLQAGEVTPEAAMASALDALVATVFPKG